MPLVTGFKLPFKQYGIGDSSGEGNGRKVQVKLTKWADENAGIYSAFANQVVELEEKIRGLEAQLHRERLNGPGDGAVQEREMKMSLLKEQVRVAREEVLVKENLLGQAKRDLEEEREERLKVQMDRLDIEEGKGSGALEELRRAQAEAESQRQLAADWKGKAVKMKKLKEELAEEVERLRRRIKAGAKEGGSGSVSDSEVSEVEEADGEDDEDDGK